MQNMVLNVTGLLKFRLPLEVVLSLLFLPLLLQLQQSTIINNVKYKIIHLAVETILVSGASGTVGSEVVKQLFSSTDVNIKAAARSVEKIKNLEGDRVKAISIDYNKPESLKYALKNVDRLFLLTPDVPNADELASNLVNEAKKTGVRYIVKQSVMGADEDANVGTMRLHRKAEKIIEESGIPYTFLRPIEFMQNFINFHGHSIKNNNAFYLPLEDAKVSVVDVRDIAASEKQKKQQQEEDNKNQILINDLDGIQILIKSE
jgi:uncharacterized protein YbjT (DUF2867 family)